MRFPVTLVGLALWTGAAADALADWIAPTGLELPKLLERAFGDEGERAADETMTARWDRPAYFDVDAWWQGPRPPSGEAVVLVIEYRDTASRPILAEVHSGLGTSELYTELHRFGGHADGRWKRARIPITSDFIYRYRPTNAMRVRLRPTEGAVAVRSARLAAPRADEEEQYNAATREWIERAQKRAEVDSRYWALAEKPVLPADWQERPLVPFRRPWLTPVRPISAPGPGEAGAPLAVQALRNEREPVQMGIYANRRPLTNVRISVDPVTDAAARTVAAVRVRVAENAKIRGLAVPDYLIEPFPQRLWPAYPFDVPSDRSHLVWLEIDTTTAAAAPGTYRTQVRITADGIDDVTVPLDITILPARLLSMEEAGLKFGASTPTLLPEFELAFLRRYNHTMVNIWYFAVQPRLTRDGDTFVLDFSMMDPWMAAAKRQGFDDIVYFLGGNPYRFPYTMHLPRTLAKTMLKIDDEGWAELVADAHGEVPDAVAPLITEWSRQFGEHSHAAGWPNVILTPFDEPAKYRHYSSEAHGMLLGVKPQFFEQAHLLRDGDPDVQIYASVHDEDIGLEFLPAVDIFCTNVTEYNPIVPEAVREAGKIFWEYRGATDRQPPAKALYTFGYMFARHGSNGSLVWAYNWRAQFDTLDGKAWILAWSTPFDVIPSVTMEALREAWDQRRLIETLKAEATEAGVDIDGYMSALYADVAKHYDTFQATPTNDMWSDARAARTLDAWRSRLIAKLLEIKTR